MRLLTCVFWLREAWFWVEAVLCHLPGGCDVFHNHRRRFRSAFEHFSLVCFFPMFIMRSLQLLFHVATGNRNGEASAYVHWTGLCKVQFRNHQFYSRKVFQVLTQTFPVFRLVCNLTGSCCNSMVPNSGCEQLHKALLNLAEWSQMQSSHLWCRPGGFSRDVQLCTSCFVSSVGNNFLRSIHLEQPCMYYMNHIASSRTFP